jgi:hypothetical protein
MIGALSKYIHEYTDCINGCDFYNTDKTKRLGFDNTVCLLKCNSYFTNLRRLNEKPQAVWFPDATDIPAHFSKDKFRICNNNLDCMERKYQESLCFRQCLLNESFFTPHRMQTCFRMCKY